MRQTRSVAGQGGNPPPTDARVALCWALAGLCVLMVLMQWLHRPIAPCADECRDRYNLLHWQLAPDASDSMRILLHWSHGDSPQSIAGAQAPGGVRSAVPVSDGAAEEKLHRTDIDAGKVPVLSPDPRLLQRLRHGLCWDFGLILSYALLGWLGTRQLLRSLGMASGWASGLACALFPLAGLTDAGENWLAWRLLSDWPLNPADLRWMTGFAMAKWALLGVALLVVVVGVLAWLSNASRRTAIVVRLKSWLSWLLRSLATVVPRPGVERREGYGGAMKSWQAARSAGFLLFLLRVPLLLVLTGVLLTFHLDQIAELFELSLRNGSDVNGGDGGRSNHALFAYLTSFWLGLAVWASARTLYSFDWSDRLHPAADLGRLAIWLPRLLASLVPLTMMVGYLRVPADDASCGCRWGWAYALQALLLFAITSWRRWIFTRTPVRKLIRPLQVAATPTVGKVTNWHATRASRRAARSNRGHGQEPVELARIWRVYHLLGILVLICAMLTGIFLPRSMLDQIGPLALILFGALWLVWASTWPIYRAARARFPIILVLLAWGTALQYLGINDNHAVRLAAGHDSHQPAPARLHYGVGDPVVEWAGAQSQARPSMDTFIKDWLAQNGTRCKRVYVISTEGGGIRAALWTVQVLNRVEQQYRHRQQSDDLWSCTIAASGVSGGALGLATFAAWQRDLGAERALALSEDLEGMLTRDFLSPVLMSMFGHDQLQRMLPFRAFSDRGQALEDAWIEAYDQTLLKQDRSAASGRLATPLASTLRAPDGQWQPALLLGTTVVASGQRLVQHPFAPLSDASAQAGPESQQADHAAVCSDAKGPSRFPGAVDGAHWLPIELPLSSAVLNSARFTYVSPAGTVLRRCPDAEGASLELKLGQLVDGGYFENSGATTAADFVRALLKDGNGPQGHKLHLLHISNEVSVAAMMDDGFDSCPVEPGTGSQPPDAPPDALITGEIIAPALALYQAREARGQRARAELHQLALDQKSAFHHFRLCQRDRRYPLGWQIGKQTANEMARQAELLAAAFGRALPKATED